MTQITGTHLTADIVGAREDLADAIYDISPEDTPLFSSVKRGKANSTFHEWQTDTLGAAAANAQLEGDEASYDTPDPTVRVGNYTQIMRKTVLTSGTLEAIDKAGRKSEEAFQLAKRSAELKLDIELAMFANNGAVAGSSSVAREFAGLGAWLKTNTDFATGGTPSGADPTYTSGAPLAARTDDGTPRAFTETILKNVIQSCWTNGGKPNVLYVGPVNKAKVSGFAGIASATVDVTKAAPTMIVGSADVYVSEFGNIRVVPTRLQREKDAYLIDHSLISMAYLRPFQTKTLAPTGDAAKKMLLVELTMRVNQEAGLGGAFDLTTT